ncbi:DUF58 domain-containing protein [Hansschlegelia plantiphila]|uniref:DUF58 domain-containing protein n=1 Tax=Hansschlegelia plantiphila TaxID=374655 RepID=A0A9W6MVH7_9HYPH|nr:hypothetical protein [Hansschlegelia plantiphila]GLK67993.1 hypothetical protein GCM10008179_16310 [Hansschlegelia plantiphila]
MSLAREPAGPPRRDLPYRLFGRARGVAPGAHRAVGSGANGAFLRHVSLLELPDARRIDMRASLLDPLGGVKVRRFERRARIDVFVVLDLSGSMAFGRSHRDDDPVADLCAAIAHAAIRGQDRFGLIAAGPTPRADFVIRATRRRGVPDEVWTRLRAEAGAGRGVGGLLRSIEELPTRRSLVFVVSDFLMPPEALDGLLGQLWRHDVVPVVVRSSAVESRLPRFGLIETRDLETGRRRLVLMRRSLRERWLAEARARRAALDLVFRSYGRPGFDLVDRFDGDAFADFLLSGGV